MEFDALVVGLSSIAMSAASIDTTIDGLGGILEIYLCEKVGSFAVELAQAKQTQIEEAVKEIMVYV